MSTQVEVVISPATRTSPVVVAASQATRAIGSSRSIASRTPSLIWSQSLSGCPSVTLSLVKNALGSVIKLLLLLISLLLFLPHCSIASLNNQLLQRYQITSADLSRPAATLPYEGRAWATILPDGDG